MEQTFNRQQYMAGECDHHTYYRQFVTPGVRTLVANMIGVERIKASTDPHFNDIPLRLWDNLSEMIGSYVGAKLGASNASTHANGARCYSLSDTVCVAKAAARMIREAA